jgi:hypothetical protein
MNITEKLNIKAHRFKRNPDLDIRRMVPSVAMGSNPPFTSNRRPTKKRR